MMPTHRSKASRKLLELKYKLSLKVASVRLSLTVLVTSFPAWKPCPPLCVCLSLSWLMFPSLELPERPLPNSSIWPLSLLYHKLTFSHVHTAGTTRTPCGSSQVPSAGSAYDPLALMCFSFPGVPYRWLSHGGLAVAPWSHHEPTSREPDSPGVTHRVTSSSSGLEQGSSLRWQKPHQLF